VQGAAVVPGPPVVVVVPGSGVAVVVEGGGGETHGVSVLL
jgi:hypothetical protein